MGEWLHRELQCSPARRTPRRRDLLHAQRGQDHRGKLASALQHRASAWIARLQAAGAGGLHPGIRAGGQATQNSDAARAGPEAVIALTFQPDPSMGADHSMLASFVAAVGEPVAGRAEPFDRERRVIVVVMRFEVGHAATSLTPDRHDVPAGLDGAPDDAVRLVLFSATQPIAALRLPMFFGIAEVLRIGALVFPAAIPAPSL